jgi:hypothetical protein
MTQIMIRKFSSLACLLVLTATRHAHAQRFVALGMPDSEVLAVLQKVQRAITAGDRATTAGMVRYPLRVNRGPDDHSMIATRDELLRRYDAVFTPEVRRAVGATNLNDVLGGVDGVALGRGEVWLTSTCAAERPRKCRLGISSLNVRNKT